MFGKIKNTLLIFTSVFILSSAFLVIKAETIKDTDFDGLSDDSELNKYRTDPFNEDTDGDTFSDLQEVLNNSDPLDSLSSPIVSLSKEEIKLIDRDDPIAWYIARISGIAAFILLTLTVALGLLQTSRALVKIRIMGVITAQEIHRFISWSGLLMVLIHAGSLVFDDYFQIKISEIIVPFVLHREFKSVLGYDFNLAVALGIIGFYTIVLPIATSELRNKIVNMKVWRTIHYASFAGYVMFVIHGFMAGSDSEESWMRVIYISSLLLTLSLLLAKIFKKQLFLKRPKPKTPIAPVKE